MRLALRLDEEREMTLSQKVDLMEETLMELIEADDFDAIGSLYVEMCQHQIATEQMARECCSYEGEGQLQCAEGFMKIAGNILKRATDRVEILNALEVNL